MPGDVETLPPAAPVSHNGHGEPEPRRKRWLEERPAASAQEEEEPSYYDIPMLKPPVWKGEISTYFFLGGLSAGSYVISRLAERIGGDEYRDLTRAGAWIAAAAAAPCAPLLLADLGDPARFHHMLRVFKPTSPMNLGSWTLTGYSAVAFLAALREWGRMREERTGRPATRGPVRLLRRADGAIVVLADAAGIPLALLLAGYTGVLLSGTANPAWSMNPYLGPLFSASAMTTGAAAVHIALEAKRPEATPSPDTEALTRIATSARAAEVATLTGYVRTAGEASQPLKRGVLAPYFWGGVVGAGLVLPEILEHLPAPPRVRRWLRTAASVGRLAGGFALRSILLKAGYVTASDPKAARAASRPKPPAPR